MQVFYAFDESKQINDHMPALSYTDTREQSAFTRSFGLFSLFLILYIKAIVFYWMPPEMLSPWEHTTAAVKHKDNSPFFAHPYTLKTN